MGSLLTVTTNSGQVDFASGFDFLVITSSGSISDLQFAAQNDSVSGGVIDNAGDLFGGIRGINIIDAKDTSLINLGSIAAGAEAIHIEAAGAHIQNSGTIAGPLGTYINVEGGTGSVTNSGLISGDQVAFYKEGGGTLSFRNSGKIDGDVVFIDGTNTFDGRKGTVVGTVTGGSGVDKIRAGNDGETLGGGNGHDRLYGGTGADTFAFASYRAADTDVVLGFDPTVDSIQLDHSVFTRLVADQTPTFAIGIKPASATDYLFYNTSTGLLFYDVDGSGTARPSYQIANLGKGLHLTAENFEVV